MRNTIIVSILLFFALIEKSSASQNYFEKESIQPSGLSIPQAKKVLIAVLKHEKYNLSRRGMAIEDDLKPMRPGYYDFSLIYDSPNAGATDVLGLYSVNILTGDVWENEQCIRYQFKKLRDIQGEIRRSTGKSIALDAVARAEVGCP